MFRAVFVHHKKNPKWGQSDQWEHRNHSVWKSYEDLDCLLNAPHWTQPCDLEAPWYANAYSGECALCTQSKELLEVHNSILLKHCNECVESDWLRNWDNPNEPAPRKVLSKVLGRPLVFFYTVDPKEKTDADLIAETNVYVDHIEDYWSFAKMCR